jgi:hypothetical protein
MVSVWFLSMEELNAVDFYVMKEKELEKSTSQFYGRNSFHFGLMMT